MPLLLENVLRSSVENSVEMTEAPHKDLTGPGPKVLGPNVHKNAGRIPGFCSHGHLLYGSATIDS
jgi:hypothetical protein